jgi:hypothetical protein
MKKSYLDCPHNRVQQFTEFCLDCGYNIYTTDEEYLADLKKKVATKNLTKKIRTLEAKL